MQKLTHSDLQDISQYELVRDDYRRDIMAHKRHRRVDLGPDVALTFEDGRTMAFQIQEMMRAEQMVTEAAIQGELDVYNDLIPESGELSATLFIEITDDARIKELLHRFIGLTDGDKLWLEAGDEQCFAQFETGRSEEDKISSVHYLRFAPGPALRAALREPDGEVTICIAQDDYRHEVTLSDETRQSLAADLAAD